MDLPRNAFRHAIAAGTPQMTGILRATAGTPASPIVGQTWNDSVLGNPAKVDYSR